MKKNIKLLIFILLILNFLIPFAFYFFPSTSIDTYNPYDLTIRNDLDYKEMPKTSTEWVIASKIHINNNWTETNSTYEWCRGSGTINDPFIIENLTIINQYEGGFISIENTNAYFIIRNCILPDIIGNLFYGIHLNNVSNGILLNNSISLNYQGIYLTNCSYILVKENSLKENRYGIYCSYSKFVNSSSNYINDSTYFGIFLRDSTLCNISENLIRNNDIYPLDPAFDRYIALYGYRFSENLIINNSVVNFNEVHEGIYLTASSNNTLIYNSVINSEYGINLDLTDSNHLINNRVNNCIWGIIINGDENNLTANQMNNCGIVLNYLGFNTQYIDFANLVNNKPVYYYEHTNNLNSHDFVNAGQIILINCSDSTISKSDVSQSSIGVYLDDCSNNSISFINSSYNQYGMFLWECRDIEVKDCEYNRNEIHGVSMRYGRGARLINNQISKNFHDGINTYQFDNVNLIGNTVNNNNYDGISITRGENAVLSYNIVNKNGIRGIFLNYVQNGSVYSNSVKRNQYDGLQLTFSSNIIIKNNNLQNNFYGIHFSYESNHNIIVQNILINNVRCINQDESSEENYFYGNLCISTKISTNNIIIFLIPICIILFIAWILRGKRL
jgi:parallel beta-helix repeat protein